jgi:hypothetical protein
MSIHQQEDFHRGMSNAFVTIDEGVIEDEGEAECCRFRREVGIQVSITETLAWLSEGRLKGVDVANTASTTPPFQDGLVKLQNFSKSEIPSHERQR